MLFKKFLTLFLVVLWVGPCLAAKGEKVEVQQAAKKISEDEVGKSLIRKDLLFGKKEKLSPPTRNIFSPHAVSKTQAELLSEEVGGSQKIPSPSSEDSARYSEGTKPDLNYLGYVKSGQKIIALIIFEGEALAVIENEMIGTGIRVGNVTSEEVELISASSQKWKYSIEGEEE
jgi:hypothetical protein